MKASYIRRGYKAVEADRLRQAVRQHNAQKHSLLKNEALPGAGIFGFLAGWSVMSLLNSLSKDRK